MSRALAGLVSLLIPSAADARPDPIEPAKFGWHSDHDAARAEARRTGKPILLVFRCEP